MDEPKVAVLRHYASPYYDPQKAHEYYMRTRELKGRSTTSLNDDGKKIWSYTKNNIKSEKAAKVKEEQEKRDQKITELREKAEATKEQISSRSVTAIRDYHDQFKQAGTYLVEGFADGISENTYRAEAKARAMARAAAEAAEDELDEHSPSRVGYHIGDFFGLGFVNAIGTYAVKAYNASAEMADSAKTGLGNAIAKVKDMIDNGVDGQPTIRPILDLSDVEEKSHRLNTLFSRSQALTVSTGIAAARGRNLQNEDTNPNTGNSYNFTQNNYSPKTRDLSADEESVLGDGKDGGNLIRAVTFTNYLGDSIRLDLARPEESGFIIKSVTGLGPGKANINTTEIATNDGSLFNSSRMPSRNIVISLAYMWKDSIEDVRQLSYKYFPIKKKLTMLIETDNRQAEIEGYVESNDPTIFSKDEGSDISIVCPNPFFYSAGKDGINTTIFYGVEALFEFPFSNESLKDPLLEMGEIKNETEQVVVYNGDAEIGVTITIHAIGEASNITIYNTGTREVMRIDTDKLEKFTGSGIIAGDEIIICTVKGNKSITLLRNGKTTNILNCLDKNADWFQLAKGDNIFAYTAEYGSTNLQFKIENRIVYEGV